MRVIAKVLLLGVLQGGTLWGQTEELPIARDPEELKKAALMIDRHVGQLYRSKKLKVPQVVDDPTFLRRSFLVSTGRIPTLEEARMFLEVENESKRELLVEHLLKSDGYRSHMTNWLLDMFRVQESFRYGGAAPYVNFLRESIASNKPWDQLGEQIVGAKGDIWQAGNGAVGYYIRDKGMPLDNLSNTMRIFTGTRMECAQCHDDPYGEYERIDFYHLAAFTSGQGEINRGVWDKVFNQAHEENPLVRQTNFGNFLYWVRDNIHLNSLGGGGHGRIKLPYDYQYSDGDPGEMVGGRTPFGERVRTSDRRQANDSRMEFAQWITSRENPRFNVVIVNRMWERVMGRPIFDPVDEYVEPEKTVAPNLLKDLVKLMQDLNYDLRAFQQVLLLTKTFQFAANSEAFEAGMPQAFNGRQIERMSAEQIWDSLVTLVKGNPDVLRKRSFSDTIYYGGKPVLVGKKTMSQLSQEILAIKDPEKYRAYVDELFKQFTATGANESGSSMAMMRGAARPGPVSGFARASELPSPAPAGHLLREFGQSDRELLDSATNEANMAQVLSIMNGYVERNVVSNDRAALYKALEQGSSDRDKVRFIYYAILSRPPSEKELSMLMREVIDGSMRSYRNLASALLATHEFIFIQ